MIRYFSKYRHLAGLSGILSMLFLAPLNSLAAESTYAESLRALEISFTYPENEETFTVPSDFSDYLLIEPQTSLTSADIETLDDFSGKGGDLFVISHPLLSEAYGVSLTSSDFETFEDPSLRDLEKQFSGEAVDTFELVSSDCATFEDFSTEKESLLLHLYCPQPDGNLSNIVFVSAQLLELFTKDATFAGQAERLTNALRSPDAVSLPPSSTLSFEKNTVPRVWVFAFQATKLYFLYALLATPFLFFFFLSFFKLQITRAKRVARSVNHFASFKLAPHQKKAAVFGVLKLGTFVLGLFYLVSLLSILNISPLQPFYDYPKFWLSSLSVLLGFFLTVVFIFYRQHFLSLPKVFIKFSLKILKTILLEFKSSFTTARQKTFSCARLFIAWCLRHINVSNPFYLRTSLGLFFISSLAFVYDVFFFYTHPFFWLSVAIFSGISSYSLLKGAYSPTPIPLTRIGRGGIHLGLAALMASPLFLIFLFFASFSLLSQTTFSLKGEIANDTLALQADPEHLESAIAWKLPHPSLLIPSQSFGVVARNAFSSPTATVHLKALVQGHAVLESIVEDSGVSQGPSSAPPLFISILEDFSLFKQMEGVSIYRRKTAPLLHTSNSEKTWEDFLAEQVPTGSVVSLLLTSDETSKPSMLLTGPILPESKTLSISSPLDSRTMTFYTVLSRSEPSFTLKVKLQPTDFLPEKSLRGTFYLRGKDSQTVYEQPFEVATLSLNKPSLLTFHVEDEDLEPGAYQFYLDLDTTRGTLPPLLLSNLEINSPYLVFSASTIEGAAEETLYFKATEKNSFSFEPNPEDDLPEQGSLKHLEDDVTLTPEDIKIDFDSLYTFTFPSSGGEWSSSSPTFYAFSEKSWFYPYPFYFSSDLEVSDYIFVENYTAPLMEGEWFWIDQLFPPLVDLSGFKLWFDFMDEAISTPQWILIKELQLSL